MLEWLGTHNFPHGIVAFSDGISPTDLLKDKMEYLIRLKNEVNHRQDLNQNSISVNTGNIEIMTSFFEKLRLRFHFVGVETT